jgi:hypothetical protein
MQGKLSLCNPFPLTEIQAVLLFLSLCLPRKNACEWKNFLPRFPHAPTHDKILLIISVNLDTVGD